MTEIVAHFTEATGDTKVRSVPLAHLSVEIGHLYLEDYAAGVEAVQAKFAAAAGWAAAARQSTKDSLGGREPRISSCYLIDDYFSPDSSPAEVIPMVLAAAKAEGITIDYLARESGCADDADISLAELVAAQIVAEPHPATNGSRPTATVTGWLSNGRRSPAGTPAAMTAQRGWQPPSESAANRHSVFLDVELWSEKDGVRQWSCPFLASVWQLARLGLLRAGGLPVLQPQPWHDPWPASWQALPGVIQLEPDAAAFSAYSTISVIDERFLPIEHAVRVILSQIAVDPTAAQQVATRAADSDRLLLPAGVVDRVGYAFVPQPWAPISSRSV